MSSSTLLHRSQVLTNLVDEARCIARCDAKVLLTGDSGVGNELIARFIHEHSSRSQRPFITVNCAGVSESALEAEIFGHLRSSITDGQRDRRGLLEMADGGTVFFHEVGEMSPRLQLLLLRFLESGEIHRAGVDDHKAIVDVRVISATHRHLFDRTVDGQFREDLYYRLNVVHLMVPAPRDRGDDNVQLIDDYVRAMADEHRLPLCELTNAI